MKAIEYSAAAVGGTYAKTGYLFENGIFISKFTFYNNKKYFSRRFEFRDPPKIIFWGKGVSSTADYDYQAFKLIREIEKDFTQFISEELGNYWPESNHENAKPLEVLLKEIENTNVAEKIVPKVPSQESYKLDAETTSSIDFCREKIKQAFKQRNNPIPQYLGQFIEALLSNTLSKIVSIKQKLGVSHEAYVGISNELCVATIELVDNYVNKSRGEFFHIPKEGIAFLKQIEALEMLEQTRQKYSKLRSQIEKIDDAANQDLKRQVILNEDLKKQKAKEGCYIATAVYGNYDHSQVRKLRMVRDEILSKNIFGRVFIKFYYKYSPMLAKKLYGKKRLNNFIKGILNFMISLL